MNRCRSCNSAIIWAPSATTDKAIPLDAKPASNGNIVIRAGKAHYVRVGHRVEMGERTYVSHFSTCPDAKQHRRPRC